MLASGSADDTIKLWDTLTNQEINIFRGHTNCVLSICFSPTIREGPCWNILASGSYDNTIKIWNTVTYEEITTLKDHTNSVNSVCFSPIIAAPCGNILVSP